jgi:hypothetical protein
MSFVGGKILPLDPRLDSFRSGDMIAEILEEWCMKMALQ